MTNLEKIIRSLKTIKQTSNMNSTKDILKVFQTTLETNSMPKNFYDFYIIFSKLYINYLLCDYANLNIISSLYKLLDSVFPNDEKEQKLKKILSKNNITDNKVCSEVKKVIFFKNALISKSIEKLLSIDQSLYLKISKSFCSNTIISDYFNFPNIQKFLNECDNENIFYKLVKLIIINYEFRNRGSEELTDEMINKIITTDEHTKRFFIETSNLKINKNTDINYYVTLGNKTYKPRYISSSSTTYFLINSESIDDSLAGASGSLDLRRKINTTHEFYKIYIIINDTDEVLSYSVSDNYVDRSTKYILALKKNENNWFFYKGSSSIDENDNGITDDRLSIEKDNKTYIYRFYKTWGFYNDCNERINIEPKVVPLTRNDSIIPNGDTFINTTLYDQNIDRYTTLILIFMIIIEILYNLSPNISTNNINNTIERKKNDIINYISLRQYKYNYCPKYQKITNDLAEYIGNNNFKICTNFP